MNCLKPLNYKLLTATFPDSPPPMAKKLIFFFFLVRVKIFLNLSLNLICWMWEWKDFLTKKHSFFVLLCIAFSKCWVSNIQKLLLCSSVSSSTALLVSGLWMSFPHLLLRHYLWLVKSCHCTKLSGSIINQVVPVDDDKYFEFCHWLMCFYDILYMVLKGLMM